MSEKGFKSRSIKNILKGSAVWFIALLILTVIVSVFVRKIDINEKTIVYISSALTFLSTAAAGFTLRSSKENMLCCLFLSIFLIIIALSFGFLMDSSRLETGGILSVVSFTLCGTMSGFVIDKPRKKGARIKI